jgi:hypothetical protein
MDIEKYKQAKRLAEEISSLTGIESILRRHDALPGVFFGGHFEFVTNSKKLVVPRVLNGEILPIIAKYGDKLKKEFDEL